MGKILGAYISPHPPIIIEEIGRGEVARAEKTVEGVKKLAEDIKAKKPTTIIVITPHGPLFSDAISISCEDNLEGSFADFGRGDLKFQFQNNRQLVKKIIRESNREGIMTAQIDKNFITRYNVSLKIDHGALVPLYFVNKVYPNYKLVHITYGLLSPLELYKFGSIVQNVVEDSEEEVVLIASGDMSHKLSDEGPYTYAKEGKIFDESIVEYLNNNDLESIVSFDLGFAERAGECGLRSFMIMAGFLEGYNIDTQVFSYEGPFGVGYLTGKIELLEKDSSRNIIDAVVRKNRKRVESIRNSEDEYVSLARKSLEYYIKEKSYLKVPKDLRDELTQNRAGVFVSLKKHGKLRGCIGTIEPTSDSIAEEIIINAVSAGLRDPRFESVEEDELESIVYSVDVLKEPEAIDSIDELDVNKYGVIVTSGYKRGLLLPNIEGVETPEEQVRIALQKAGIRGHESYKMERFEVVRHH